MNPRKRLMLKKKARQKAAQANVQAEISLPTEVDLITEEEPVEAKTKTINAVKGVAVRETDNTISKKNAKKSIKAKKIKTTSKGE
tara:strand:+ start:391 stop:645 length:255 start_codon:yes stop_codon:yes gene_type:complete